MILFDKMWMDVLFFISLFIGYLYRIFTRKFNHWKNKGVIFDPPIPIFGNSRKMLLMQKCVGEAVKELYDKFPNEPYIGIYHSSRPALLLRDPDLIKQIIVKDFSHFQDREIIKDEFFKREPLRENLVALSGQKWKQLRQKLTPTFTSGKLRAMFHLLWECSRDFRTLLDNIVENNEIIEARELTAKYTTEVIGSVAFGIETHSIIDPNSKFREMGRKIFEAGTFKMIKFYLRSFLPKLSALLNFNSSNKDIQDFFTRTVSEVIEHRKQNNVKRNDFMQLLIQLKEKGYIDNPDEKDATFTMDDNLVAAQAFIFFLAGFETSSTAMSFILYELAMNPDIQQRVQTEIDQVLEKHGGILTYDAVLELTYLEKVFCEGLRKYPPVGILRRLCTIPYVIPGTNVKLERGDLVQIPVYGLHHDPRYYPNPDKFDPERFSDEGKRSRHSYTYLPFGDGPRNCIGLRFAKFQSIAGLVSILEKYTLSPCSKTDIPLKFSTRSVILQTKKGIWLDIKHRER